MPISEPSWSRRVPVIPILLGGILWGVAEPSTAQPPPGNSPEYDSKTASPTIEQEQAIRDFNSAFEEAYNQEDASTLAALYTEDAEVFEADGARYCGRALIERTYSELFESEPGARLQLSPEEFRLLSPDVAKEEGRSVVSPAVGSPSSRFYTALFVKRDGRWLLAGVREEVDSDASPRDRLDALDWMIGEWIDEGPESRARVECRRSPDGNFLLRELSLKQAGEVVLEVSQRVGWDPIDGAFRSWEFDSDGGFGEATWTRDGDRWIVFESGVSSDGVAASSIRILERVGPDQVRWTRVDRTVDGEGLPGEERSILTRVPPSPGLSAEAPPSTSPASDPTDPDHERNPR